MPNFEKEKKQQQQQINKQTEQKQKQTNKWQTCSGGTFNCKNDDVNKVNCCVSCQLRTAIERDVKEAGLKPHPSTILKVIQLYETKNSRYFFHNTFL